MFAVHSILNTHTGLQLTIKCYWNTLQIHFDGSVVNTRTCKFVPEIVALFVPGYFLHLGLYYSYTNLQELLYDKTLGDGRLCWEHSSSVYKTLAINWTGICPLRCFLLASQYIQPFPGMTGMTYSKVSNQIQTLYKIYLFDKLAFTHLHKHFSPASENQN